MQCVFHWLVLDELDQGGDVRAPLRACAWVLQHVLCYPHRGDRVVVAAPVCHDLGCHLTKKKKQNMVKTVYT